MPRLNQHSYEEKTLIIPKSLETYAKKMYPSGYYMGMKIIVQEYIINPKQWKSFDAKTQ